MPNESSRCTVVIKSFVYYYNTRVSVPVKTQSIYYDSDFVTEATVEFFKAPTTHLRDVPMDENNLFRVLPNPVSQTFFLEFENTDNREMTFVITNTLGQIVKIQTHKVESGRNRLFFEVFDLPKDTYFITSATNNGKNVSTKFVKF